MDKIYKTVEIQIYPNEWQKSHLLQSIGACRFVYNYFLAKTLKHLNSKKKNKKPYWYKQWCAELTILKRDPNYTWLKEINAQALQQSLQDLNEAFSLKFKNVKHYGFPKFHKKGIKNSYRVPQNTYGIKIWYNKIQLPNLKKIRFRGNQDNIQKIKINRATIKLKAGKWFVYLLTEDNKNYMDEPPLNKVGIDLGIKKPITMYYKDTTGSHFKIKGKKYSKRLEKAERKRKLMQRRFDKKQKDSKNQAKAKQRFQTAYFKETCIRKDWVEKTSYELATTFKTIVFENLHLDKMTRKGGNKRKLNDGLRRLGLGMLFVRTKAKAEKFGSQVIFVSPHFTSQTCPKCSHCCKENRKTQAKFECVSCGYKKNADKVAALNVYKKAA